MLPHYIKGGNNMMNELKKQEIVALLNNAICFMYENNMSKKEIADYLGTDNETLDAIVDKDFEFLVERR